MKNAGMSLTGDGRRNHDMINKYTNTRIIKQNQTCNFTWQWKIAHLQKRIH